MDGNRPPRITLNYKPEKHRGTRRPKTRWKDEFN
jgi:hypothetical protein